jgi:hypothetical protein
LLKEISNLVEFAKNSSDNDNDRIIPSERDLLSTINSYLSRRSRPISVRVPPLTTAFLAISWRVRKQGVVALAHYNLCLRGLLDITALQTSIDYFDAKALADTQVGQLQQALETSFSFWSELLKCQAVALLDGHTWEVPMRWLACMFVRGVKPGVTLEMIIRALQEDKCLGTFTERNFRIQWKHGNVLRVEKVALQAELHDRPCHIGVILYAGDRVPRDLETYLAKIEETLKSWSNLLNGYFMLNENKRVKLLKQVQ